jgi:hypothetical protein
VRVALRLELDPTSTLPKLRVAGERVSFAGELALPVPVPEIGMARVGFAVLLVSVKVTSVYPRAVGVKLTGNSTVVHAARVRGKGKLSSENALPPFADMELMVSAALPVFVSWME